MFLIALLSLIGISLFTFFPSFHLALFGDDGENLLRYGYPVKFIPIDHIYAFKLEGRDSLINITNEVRQKLLESK